MIKELLLELGDDLVVILLVSLSAIVRAMFRTIDSGHEGLRFTFGRASNRLGPGLHFFVPFVQTMRMLPSRARTLDLPAQRVNTQEGLVYQADANMVYRVVDIRKALIQVDQLEKAMLQMLGLSVQEVLRVARRDQIRNTDHLNQELHESLQKRLSQWGVQVEHAGFPSIAPSAQSIRITQLDEVTRERQGALAQLTTITGSASLATALVGTRQMPMRRTRALQRMAFARRRVNRIRKVLRKRGWSPAQVRRAEWHLRSRLPVKQKQRLR
jgi:regulator of protease activity HflC (stomatin/prohibitin superfamily)